MKTKRNDTNSTKKTILFYAIGIILCLLQSCIKTPSIFQGVCFLLPFSILIPLFEDDTYSVVFALVTGLLIDCISGGMVAYNAIFFIIISYLTYSLAQRVINVSFKTSLILSAIYSVIYYLIYAIIFRTSNVFYYILHFGFKYILITFALIIPCYFIVKLIEKKLGKEAKRCKKKNYLLD